MRHLKRLIVFACLALAGLPIASATAAQRMYVGFQDDPSFRFRAERQDNLDEAQKANATIIRTQVSWFQVAPTRPGRPAFPFDPAYKQLNDVDDLVRSAQIRGMEVLITIYGTPGWANGGKKPNSPPTRMSDLTDFATAIANRYSGRHPGYPYVRFFSIWNEPNLNQFLTPQFSNSGADVAPAVYAKMYRAAYAGIKAGNPLAQVGIGETSARGHDKPTVGTVQDSHSPGKFAQLVAKADKSLKFDAWAEHPYPFRPSQAPTDKVNPPNVSLTQLEGFQKTVDKAFGRTDTPIWVTEYSHETKPAEPRGVSLAAQAAYAKQALAIVKNYSFVPMFIWFVLRDDPSDPWQSGLLDEAGKRKPGFATFTASAKPLDARDAIIYVKAGKANPIVRVSAIELAGRNPTGTKLGVTYRVVFKNTVESVAQPVVKLQFDGWITLKLGFTPVAKRSYKLSAQMGDPHGNQITRNVTLVAVK